MYYEKECYECNQKDVIIDNVKYWLEAVIDHLYSNNSQELDNLEFCLDELCRSVNMRLPEVDLKIQKLQEKPFASVSVNFKRDTDWAKVYTDMLAHHVVENKIINIKGAV